MKAVFALGLLLSAPAFAQDEASLRAADQAQLVAARAGNADALAAMTLPGFIINNPLGETGTGARMIQRFRSGETKLERLARIIERVSIDGDTGVVMGREVVISDPASLEGKTRAAGKPVLRRFTNMYLWRDGAWKWFARHASERPEAPNPDDLAKGSQ